MKDELIAALDINSELCGEDHTDKGLTAAYAKWKAITEAYKKMQTMNWVGTKPTYGTIIALFVSTSMFYSHYKHFNKAVKYPEMVEWLEERPDGPSNMDIWGYEKAYYNFSDLVKWLEAMAEDRDSSDGGKRKVFRRMEKSSSSQPSLKDGKRKHKSKAKGSKK